MNEIPDERTSTKLADQRSASRRRPFGVTAVASLQAAISVSAIYNWWQSGPFDAGFSDPAVYLNSLAVCVAVTGLIVGFGLLLTVRWAWPLALFVLSVQLAVGLWAYTHDHAVYETMALSVASILYLNSRDVRRAFGYIRARDSIPIE